MVALAMVSGCATWWERHRIVDHPCWHAGVRAAPESLQAIESRDWGVTLQVTTDAPVCREVYP